MNLQLVSEILDRLDSLEDSAPKLEFGYLQIAAFSKCKNWTCPALASLPSWSFQGSFFLWEWLPFILCGLSLLTENVLRKPNSKLESRSHVGRAIIHVPLIPAERKFSSPSSNSKLSCLQPMRSCHHFGFSFPPRNFCSKLPPNFPLSSIKECSPHLFSTLAYGLSLFVCPELQFLWYSQIKSIFLAELLSLFF